jgi:excisionase family DNA binding protein
MRALGKFQMAQMKAGDPRVPQLFRALRQALDLLEEISLRPHKDTTPVQTTPPSAVPPAPVIEQPTQKLAYSIKEVRALTGISTSKIYSEIQMGRLRSSKNGGRTLILAGDLQAWMGGWRKDRR